MEHKRIYAKEKGSHPPLNVYWIVSSSIPFAFAVFALPALYLQAKSSTESTEERKPKAYFQFWGFHIFVLLFLIYTAIYNSHQEAYIVIVWFFTVVNLLVYNTVTRYFIKSELDIETPTHCCRCSPRVMVCCHHLMLWLSTWILLVFTTFFLYSIPTILLIYYLNPVGTLLHLPLVINAVLYTNSLLALLIYQCESCCHLCTRRWKGKLDNNPVLSCPRTVSDSSPVQARSGCLRVCARKSLDLLNKQLGGNDIPHFQKRAKNHDKYYEPGFNNSRLADFMQLIRPIFTIGILGIFLYFIYLFYQISKLHLSKEDNFTVLLSLVPNLLLLFGSWYNLHLFWDFEKDKTEKEILKEILEHMKQHGQQPPTAIAEGHTDTPVATQPTGGPHPTTPPATLMQRYGSVAETPTGSSGETYTQLAEREDECYSRVLTLQDGPLEMYFVLILVT